MTDTMPISSITVPAARKRPLGDVTALAESISQNGLLNAITVTRDGTLISGLHRLEACKLLGWAEIPANVTDLEGLRAELAEIDENLVRSELTVLQQADHLARRVEILEALGQRAPGHRPEKGATLAPLQTTAEIAAEMGMSKRSAQVRLQIARGLVPEVKEAIGGTELANRTTSLLEVAQAPPERQMAIVESFYASRNDPDGEPLEEQPSYREPTVGDVMDQVLASPTLRELDKKRQVSKHWNALSNAVRALRQLDPEAHTLVSQWDIDGREIMVGARAKEAQEWLNKVHARLRDPRGGVRLA